VTLARLAQSDRLRLDLAFGVDFIPCMPHRGTSDQSSESARLHKGREELTAHALSTLEAPVSNRAEHDREGAAEAEVATVLLRQMGEGRAEALARLAAAHAASCPHCTRATGHTNLVFGEGSAEAAIVFVGEAPGESEDLSGRPFVGRAGQKLDEMIVAMGLRREQVYIANVLKARPPNNRTPLPEEVARCGPTLLQQLAVIRPRAIVTLGAPAAKFLLQTEVGISRLRGIWASWAIPDSLGGGEIDVMPTFHPAYLLRNYTPETRKAVWSDLQQVMSRVGPTGSDR